MADKIQVVLDTAKLKGLTKARTFKTKDGADVTVNELKFELVPVKEPKTIHSAEKYDLVKTHFAAALQTNEQRDAGEATVFLGDGITTVWKNQQHPTQPTVSEATVVDDDPFG